MYICFDFNLLPTVELRFTNSVCKFNKHLITFFLVFVLNLYVILFYT